MEAHLTAQALAVRDHTNLNQATGERVDRPVRRLYPRHHQIPSPALGSCLLDRQRDCVMSLEHDESAWLVEYPDAVSSRVTYLNRVHHLSEHRHSISSPLPILPSVDVRENSERYAAFSRSCHGRAHSRSSPCYYQMADRPKGFLRCLPRILWRHETFRPAAADLSLQRTRGTQTRASSDIHLLAPRLIKFIGFPQGRCRVETPRPPKHYSPSGCHNFPLSTYFGLDVRRRTLGIL